MASYEELFGPDGTPEPGARTTGGFRFPTKSPETPKSPPIRPVACATLVQDVLRAPVAAPAPAPRHVRPLVIEPGSYQEQILEKAASELRTIRIAGKRRVPYDPDNPEPFWEACADTAKAALEVEAAITDPDEAAIATAIFKAAGFYSGGLQLLTLRAQVEAQMLVIEKARGVKFQFARQQELEGVLASPGSALFNSPATKRVAR